MSTGNMIENELDAFRKDNGRLREMIRELRSENKRLTKALYSVVENYADPTRMCYVTQNALAAGESKSVQKRLAVQRSPES